MYYIHKDYPGSYQTITDAAGHVVERLSFDPWGRRRNAQTWTFSNVPSSYLFDRGFTGHQHMGHFALINMGGRVYDPVLGSFLSPDPFVQAPANPQNYNRYGYALNNPLKYTDPTGYQTASAPGAVSWLGGGGGWGESGGWGNVGPHWSHYMPNVFSDPVWGYRYDWDTKTYYAEHYYGNDEVVSFEEVKHNYVLPNAYRHYTGEHAALGYSYIVENLKRNNLLKYSSSSINSLISINSEIRNSERAGLMDDIHEKPSALLIEKLLKLLTIVERGRHASSRWIPLDFNFNVGSTPEKNALGLLDFWEYHGVKLFAGKREISADFYFLPSSVYSRNFITQVHVAGYATNYGFGVAGYQIYLRNSTGWDIGIINFGSNKFGFINYVNFLRYR